MELLLVIKSMEDMPQKVSFFFLSHPIILITIFFKF